MTLWFQDKEVWRKEGHGQRKHRPTKTTKCSIEAMVDGMYINTPHPDSLFYGSNIIIVFSTLKKEVEYDFIG